MKHSDVTITLRNTPNKRPHLSQSQVLGDVVRQIDHLGLHVEDEDEPLQSPQVVVVHLVGLWRLRLHFRVCVWVDQKEI